MKTLVKAEHLANRSCSTSWANPEGRCSGHMTADWLNSLGEDDEPYGSVPGITNGRVRMNWLNGPNATHIVPASQPYTKSCPTCGGRGIVTIGS